MEMHEPYTFLNGLTVSDMEDLVEDIQVPALLLLCLGSGVLWQLCFPAHGAEQVPDVSPDCRCTWSWSKGRTWTSGGT